MQKRLQIPQNGPKTQHKYYNNYFRLIIIYLKKKHKNQPKHPILYYIYIRIIYLIGFKLKLTKNKELLMS